MYGPHDEDIYGTAFRWFAYRPVFTNDRGWRWLRVVWRRRCYANNDIYAGSYWMHSVERF